MNVRTYTCVCFHIKFNLKTPREIGTERERERETETETDRVRERLG